MLERCGDENVPNVVDDDGFVESVKLMTRAGGRTGLTASVAGVTESSKSLIRLTSTLIMGSEKEDSVEIESSSRCGWPRWVYTLSPSPVQ